MQKFKLQKIWNIKKIYAAFENPKSNFYYSLNEFFYKTFWSYWIHYVKRIYVWPYRRKGGNIMRGITFVNMPLEVWTRLLSVLCFGYYFCINTKINESSFMFVGWNFGLALSKGKVLTFKNNDNYFLDS